MNPSIEDRLSSVVRALTDIILPALPADAALAREQLMLSIGHLQIIGGQVPDAAAFRNEELADARALAEQLVATADGAAFDVLAVGDLRRAAAQSHDAGEINRAIHIFLRTAGDGAMPGLFARLGRQVVAAEERRSSKNRRWFKAMGFDQEIS